MRQPRDLTASARKDSPHQVSKAEHEEAGTQTNLPLDGLKQNTNRAVARVGSLTPGAGLSSTAQQHNGAQYVRKIVSVSIGESKRLGNSL